MNLESISIKEQVEKAKERLEPIKPITIDDVRQVLDITIKKDDENKIVTFLAMLAAYTDNAQFNISFNAPSSSGKSFIPLEVSSLFPSEDVMKYGNCSPAAFFHENGVYNKETNEIFIDLSRKIIIFLDMPHPLLLEKLRSLLSHDEKEMKSKITDKSERGGHKTKNVVLKGFPSVIFCSANSKLDEQEMTRFILLSPQTDMDKVIQGINLSVKRESDKRRYYQELNANPARRALVERIAAIKDAGIDEIIIENQESVRDRFLSNIPRPQPRNQRDVKRLLSIIKSIALLNLWTRRREGNTLYASEEDVSAGFDVWNKISLCQELQVSPYIYQFYEQIILPLWNKPQFDEFTNEPIPEEKKLGVNRQTMLAQYYHIHGRPLSMDKLRNEYLPGLKASGIILEEPDPNNRKWLLTYPAIAKREINEKVNEDEEHSVADLGVDKNDEISAEDVPF